LAAAKAAGMPCIIIRNPLNENIDFSGAALVLESLKEFVDLAGRLNTPGG